MYQPLRHLSLQANRTSFRFFRLLSTHASLQTSSSSSSSLSSSHDNNNNKSLSREDLHRFALMRNKEYRNTRQRLIDAETNVAMTNIPRDIKFVHTDSLELRDFKRRQQYYYFLEQRYGFLSDILVKLNLCEQKEVDEKREWLKNRIKSNKWITDEGRKSSISLRALALVQKEYGVPTEMLIEKEDSLETKQSKIKQQINFWISQTTESLENIPHDGKTVREAIKQAKTENRLDFSKITQEDVELFLLEHEEDLKKELEWDEKEFLSFTIQARKLAALTQAAQTTDSLVKTGPLEKLQLLAPHSLEKVERALKKASELYTKRAEEFELRFGNLPLQLENDPYILEAEAQMKFVEDRPAPAIEAKSSSEEGAEAGEGEAKVGEEGKEVTPAANTEKEGEGEVAIEGEAENDTLGVNEVYEDDLLHNSESEAEDANLTLYAANRKKLTFLSTPEEDGEHWPRIVDGVDLTNPDIQRIREFDYDNFEEAPTALEVRILDAFAVQRQLRNAQKNNVTLIPRVHIPYTPADRSYIAKTLMAYRLHALRTHIHSLREDAKVQYDREYRDLSKLNLRIPFDPVNPWKQDIFDQLELVLTNQGNWTTGQKEDCLVKFHRMLTDGTFSQENYDLAQL